MIGLQIGGVESQFKKGHQPHNTKYDNCISIRYTKGRPYKHIRVGLGKWVLLHRKIWIDAYGIPEKNQIIYFKDGDSISLVDLMYFECPSCGKRHFVQIDNAETKGLLLEVVRVFAKLSKMRKQGKSTKKKSGKYKKANGDLDKARNKLMKEYSSKTVHLEELNQDVILEFSV